MMPIRTHLAQPHEPEFFQGNHFLKKNKQNTAGKKEQLWLAYLEGQPHIIGAVRWCPYAVTATQTDFFWVRNLFTLPQYRQQGVASQLLRTALQTNSQQTSWGFIQPSLVHFYQKLGWQVAQPEQLPEYLQQKYQIYQVQGQAFVIIYFPVSNQ